VKQPFQNAAKSDHLQQSKPPSWNHTGLDLFPDALRLRHSPIVRLWFDHDDDIRITIRTPLEHQSNHLYDLWVNDTHFILKEYLKQEEWAEAPLREYQALDLAAGLDIAPRPVTMMDAIGVYGPMVIYEYLEGTMWDRGRPAPAELEKLADIWLRMNSIKSDDLWLSRGSDEDLLAIFARIRDRYVQYSVWAQTNFPVAMPAAQDCLELTDARRAVVELLTSLAPVMCFCRADPRFANVITRPDGRLAMVDWEDSGLRDPARDVADLMTHSNQEDLLTSAEWQSFLEPYLAARGAVDPEIVLRSQLYLAIFPLFYLAVLVGHGMERWQSGRLDGWRINTMAPNVRLGRLLARAKAWPAEPTSEHFAAHSATAFFPASA
jgi:Ser/Thr protein kinase RdoA (MazF antagonist)